MEKPTTADFKIPYRSLAQYVGKLFRVYVKDHPLVSHPPVYEGLLSAVFEDPPAILLEDASLLVLNYVPIRNFYRIVGKNRVGSVFIKIEDLLRFEILEAEMPDAITGLPSPQKARRSARSEQEL